MVLDPIASAREQALARSAFVEGDPEALAEWRRDYGPLIEEAGRAAAVRALYQAQIEQSELRQRDFFRSRAWRFAGVMVLTLLVTALYLWWDYHHTF